LTTGNPFSINQEAQKAVTNMKKSGHWIIQRSLYAIVMMQVTLAGCALPPRQLPATQPSPTQMPPTQLPSTPLPSQLIVKTDLGSLEGVVEDGVTAFKGIPYAAPPVGDLRWREPQLAAAWDGVRKADTFGKACIQPAVALGDVGPLSEDCLYLNVWTPGADPSAKRPVMVWIHGGAFNIGVGSMDAYNGLPLAKKGAVVVNFNYRLGQLGFFAHPALEKESPGGPMNFGLFDQIAALKWVQRSIAAFGGDPNNVTIFGQSAGGRSVLSLFASPLARGLFHKGIAESSYAIPDATRAKALEVGAKIADAVGLNGADATVADLRAVPAEKFGQIKGIGLSMAPVPISGDAVLPQPIIDTFAQGEEAPLPLIIGSTSDEASVAAAFGLDPAAVLQRLGAASIVVKALYPGVTDDSQLGREAMRDLLFTMMARWIADRHSRLAPSWRYYFTYVPVNNRAKQPYGVPHDGEIVFVMGTGDIDPHTKDTFTDADREMSRRVSDYWFEFARTGTPASNGSPEWPNHTVRQDRTMEFGETIAVQTNFMKRRLDLFIGILRTLDRILDRE
jgi:para-nitrobenzyl esterase